MRINTQIFVGGLSLLVLATFSFGSIASAGEGASQEPRVPFKFAVGKKKFQESCSACHGKWLGGTMQGPPLLHGFYKPSHHGDPAFYRAALKGVRAHHWKFGNMPPVNGITRKDLDQIIPFVRWFQHEKGLF